MVQLSHPYMTTGKTIVLTRRTFVSKVMSLLFNMLSRFCHSFSSKEQVSWWSRVVKNLPANAGDSRVTYLIPVLGRSPGVGSGYPEKTLESPLDCKEIQPVNPKGNQSWIFIGRTDAEAETPILWPHDRKKTHQKSPWCWERLKAGREGDNRGWDDWMASLTRWIWV